MWFLTSAIDPRVIYVLPGKYVTIGRSGDGNNCNFAVPGDPSLSRKHASLSIVDSTLILCDLGSKYGTFINHSKEKINSNTNLTLNVNDTVKFGKLNCEWEVKKISFVTCTSTLKGENIQNLKMILDKLGGLLETDWNDSCTYLTMPAITLTIKVVLALVQGAYIVETDYWNKCLEAISENNKLPEPGNFTPQVVESTLNKESVSFLPAEGRQFLFAGKSIIFFSKRQLEMYRQALEKSSATAMLLSDTKMTKSMLCGNNVIVIQYNMMSISQETEAQREQIKDIVNYLRGKGKRVVADAEIGLAILYCSTDKYCNPDYNFTMEVIKQSEQTAKINNILAQDTENTSQVIFNKGNIIIDESLTAPYDISGNEKDESVIGKRKLSEDEDTSVNKKMAVEVMDTLPLKNVGNKRAAESDIQSDNPKKMAVEISVEEDSFNFIKNENKNDKKMNIFSNTLSMIKPKKRKVEQDDDEGLFNFVRKKPATEQNTESNNSHAESNNSHAHQSFIQLNDIDELDNKPEIVSGNSRLALDDKVDIKSLRGSKLTELIEQNSKMEAKIESFNKIVKTENDDAEEFGSTVVVVKNDLIVKREPLPVKDASDISLQKNFKNFKKVWPLKIQLSMSKLSLSGT